MLSAPSLFSISQGVRNEGKFECHWCADPCSDIHTHDDPPMVLFMKRTSTAKRPANNYCCEGCWMWRRTRVTIQFLDGGQKDIQRAADHSWFITENGAWALRPVDAARMYEKMLLPPKRFVLSLMINGPDLSGLTPLAGKLINQLHMAHANDVTEQTPRTQYLFTLNNIPHTYSPYELEEALRNGGTGKEPGVQALIRALGTRSVPPLPERIEDKGPGTGNSRGGKVGTGMGKRNDLVGKK